MSRDLPFFKFFPAAWLSGNITLEDYKVQGLFINICAYYWERECQLSLDHLNKKFQRHAGIEVLVQERIIKVSGDAVNIDFLDEQFAELAAKKEKLSIAGKKGMKNRWKAPKNKKVYKEDITRLQPPYNNKDKEEEKDIYTVFDCWNRQNIIVHRQLNDKTAKAIEKSRKRFTDEQLKSAIQNYKACLEGDYFLNYKWELSTFLSRDGNENPAKFLEGGEHYENFINKERASMRKAQLSC